MVRLKDCIWLSDEFFAVTRGVGLAMIRFRKGYVLFMLKDIHTHRLISCSDEQLLSCSYRDRSSSAFQQAVHLSVGIHPWYLTEEDFLLQQSWVEQMFQDERVIAVGEGGLDKCCATPMQLQERAFRWLIECAEEHRLPLIIHCVKCTAEVLRLKKEYIPKSPWIIHGFRGKPQQAVEYLRHGFYLSFGERYSAESLRQTPLERLLLETDESLLTIDEIYEQAAATREIPLKTLEDSVFENINYLF